MKENDLKDGDIISERLWDLIVKCTNNHKIPIGYASYIVMNICSGLTEESEGKEQLMNILKENESMTDWIDDKRIGHVQNEAHNEISAAENRKEDLEILLRTLEDTKKIKDRMNSLVYYSGIKLFLECQSNLYDDMLKEYEEHIKAISDGSHS